MKSPEPYLPRIFPKFGSGPVVFQAQVGEHSALYQAQTQEDGSVVYVRIDMPKP